jgi:CheY-like chemotaxis protein
MRQLDIACIIDDDELFTYVLSKQMEVLGFCKSVIVFPNGLEALNRLRQLLDTPEALPSVIFLDLNMPVLDGWQFLDKFQRLQPAKKIAIYIVSSSIDAADHEKALAYNEVANFFIKPVTKENLVEVWNQMLPSGGNSDAT